MASFNNHLTPLLGKYRRVAVASICTALYASYDSFSPPTVLAFSHQNVLAAGVGGPSSSVIGVPSSSYSFLTASRRVGGIPYTQSTRFTDINAGELRRSLTLHSKPRKYDIDLTALPSDSADEEAPTESSPANESSSTLKQDLLSIATLVGAQALLLPISVFLAKMLNIPNRGLGVGFAWTSNAAISGVQWTVPLFAIAFIMRLIEPYSPALQGVTKATQRSVLAVMGKERRPMFALLVSILLGAVAGWGEEWLFRGVFQTALSEKFSSNIALAISGIVFGLLHAVTPVYALLAAAASVFFGYLYNVSQNLAVPMICHAVYDVGALMWAHWSVTALTSKEQDDIMQSGPGSPINMEL